MNVAVSTDDPHMLVPIPMMVAVVITFGRCNDAARSKQCEAQKDAAQYHTFCVFHVVSCSVGFARWELSGFRPDFAARLRPCVLTRRATESCRTVYRGVGAAPAALQGD
jgi:hypothetical protein